MYVFVQNILITSVDMIVVSSLGVPLRRKFDAMCSYQWSIQTFVRDFYMDLHMRSLEVWMDIWGGMQGNINEAMANAVECSTTVICFLTAKYQQSVNCCLELKYALSKGKPIIFIKVEPKLSLLPWISEVVARSKVIWPKRFSTRFTLPFTNVERQRLSRSGNFESAEKSGNFLSGNS